MVPQNKQNIKFSLSIESLIEKFLYYLEYEKITVLKLWKIIVYG